MGLHVYVYILVCVSIQCVCDQSLCVGDGY